ncbi:MAG: hypothetical protein GY794_17260 [bacterium]|nr:hypothetical protein [bacterium]
MQLLFDDAVMFRYHYNAQDRVVKVDDVNGNTVSEYFYDPFGRRLWKEVDGTRTYFFYADEGLVAEYDAAGNETTSYGYKPDSTWSTDPLWLRQNGEYYFYQNDHLGTPQKLVRQNGAVVWSASYSAFGQARVEVETVMNNLRFPGQYFDAETGLHYNFHRYYTPGNGRYMRIDPISIGTVQLPHNVMQFISSSHVMLSFLYRPQLHNSYIYVLNNPFSFSDATGLFSMKDCIASCIRDVFKEEWEKLKSCLKIGLVAGVISGPVICGLVVVMEPYLAPTFPMCAVMVSISTTSLLIRLCIASRMIVTAVREVGCVIGCRNNCHA